MINYDTERHSFDRISPPHLDSFSRNKSIMLHQCLSSQPFFSDGMLYTTVTRLLTDYKNMESYLHSFFKKPQELLDTPVKYLRDVNRCCLKHYSVLSTADSKCHSACRWCWPQTKSKIKIKTSDFGDFIQLVQRLHTC